MRTRIAAQTLVALLVSISPHGCSFETLPPTGPRVHRVLFIGSSHFVSNDLPGMVQALADSAGGDRIVVEVVARPAYALIDHWKRGTQDEIAGGGWRWVVLQQGPSAAALNRDTLRLATRLFGGEIDRAGARAALFSVWPSESRLEDFPRAIESYALAASDVGGITLPVAAAWLEAWKRAPDLQLYSDGTHASPEGAYLAVLVVYGKLLTKSPIGLPETLVSEEGFVISIAPATASLLQDAAAAVLQQPPE